jgi:hypothetical protein
MDADFPAAHSMDTAFFAVDRDGHVALFDTGEAGAVPTEAPCVEYDADASELYAHLESLPPTEMMPDLLGRLLPGPFAEPHESVNPPLPGHTPNIALLLTSTELVQKELAAGRAIRIATADGEAIFFRRLPPGLARRIHNAGHCRTCVQVWDDDRQTPGLFRYRALYDPLDGEASGPYGRGAVPLQPLHVDQLPPRMRRLVNRFQVKSVCFAEALHIHPAEHSQECVLWGDVDAYLSSDGTHIRPLPGRADKYAEDYEVIRRRLSRDPRGHLIQLEEPPQKKRPSPRKKKGGTDGR